MIRTLARSLREYKEALLSQFFYLYLKRLLKFSYRFVWAEVIDKGVDLGNMSNVWK